jgi:hypothetical protein
MSGLRRRSLRPWALSPRHNEEGFFARRAAEDKTRRHAIPRCVKKPSSLRQGDGEQESGDRLRMPFMLATLLLCAALVIPLAVAQRDSAPPAGKHLPHASPRLRLSLLPPGTYGQESGMGTT